MRFTVIITNDTTDAVDTINAEGGVPLTLDQFDSLMVDITDRLGKQSAGAMVASMLTHAPTGGVQ